MFVKCVKTMNDDVDECCICLDPISNNNKFFLICGHYLHKECWDLISSNLVCPICGINQYTDNFETIYIDIPEAKKKKCCCVIT